MPHNRQELIDQLMWNEGGYGFGPTLVGSSMLWRMRRASKENDLMSIVLISGPATKYSDEELAQLVEFSKKKTAEYDAICIQRMGANLILIDKSGGQWMGKRLSWEVGPMWHPTLQKVFDAFKKTS